MRALFDTSRSDTAPVSVVPKSVDMPMAPQNVWLIISDRGPATEAGVTVATGTALTRTVKLFVG